jgi:hypothetical protein
MYERISSCQKWESCLKVVCRYAFGMVLPRDVILNDLMHYWEDYTCICYYNGSSECHCIIHVYDRSIDSKPKGLIRGEGYQLEVRMTDVEGYIDYIEARQKFDHFSTFRLLQLIKKTWYLIQDPERGKSSYKEKSKRYKKLFIKKKPYSRCCNVI